MKLVLVIPAYDEEPVIGGTLRALPPDMFARVIVAVNGSRDGTARVAREHGAEVVETPERGYGAACLKALEVLDDPEAIVLWLQADGSEDAGEAVDLARPIEEGRADLVIGSRVARASAGALLPHQRFGNALASFLIRVLYGHRYTDLGPFRAIRVRDLRRLDLRDRNFGWTVEMQVRALQEGLRVVEVPVSYGLRRAGAPKVAGNWRASGRAGWVILVTIWRLFRFGARR
jgi:glycosyltransferase involved in cell wall biosynthesis